MFVAIILSCTSNLQKDCVTTSSLVPFHNYQSCEDSVEELIQLDYFSSIRLENGAIYTYADHICMPWPTRL